MFSHNGLISEKQMRSMLMLYVFSGGIFVLPHLFALMFGNNIMAGVMVFIPMASIYVWVMTELSEKITHDQGNSRHSTFYIIVQVMRYILRLSFYIILSVSILSEGQVPFINKADGNSIGNLLVLMPLLLVAFYGASHNLEKMGRLSEMILPAAMFPYAIMLLFGVMDIDLSECCRIMPVDMSVGKMLLSGYALLTFIVPMEIYPELKLSLEEDDTSKIRFYISILFIVILEVFLSLLMAGICGIHGMIKEPAATVSIMRYIELPMGILQRFDVLMVWFYMTGCFVLLCSTLFYIRRNLLSVVPEKCVTVILAFILAAACVIAYMCPGYEDMVDVFVVYGALVDVPLSIIMLVVRRLRYRKMAAMVMLLICTAFLSGCSYEIENVEQRDYATVLMISPGERDVSDDGEIVTYQYTVGIAGEHHNGVKSESEKFFEVEGYNLEDLSKKYGDLRGKDLSLSHLKVILITPLCVDYSINKSSTSYGKSMREKGSERRFQYLDLPAVMEEFDKQMDVAKTCPLLFVCDEKKIMDLFNDADEPVGTYISNLVRTSERDNDKIPRLMDYLKAIRDDKEVDVAVLDSKDNNLIIVR